MVVATSMQKIRNVALSVQKLGWGGNFYPHPPPPPPHPFSVHKKAPSQIGLKWNQHPIVRNENKDYLNYSSMYVCMYLYL